MVQGHGCVAGKHAVHQVADPGWLTWVDIVSLAKGWDTCRAGRSQGTGSHTPLPIAAAGASITACAPREGDSFGDRDTCTQGR